MEPRPVLYVEDEENDVLFMRRNFAQAGVRHPLHVARDGREAIDYLTRAADDALPCLVLLDLNLPMVSGFEVLEWTRAQPRLSELPVIVISSSAQPSDIARATDCGANSYVVKPSSLSQLAHFVRQIQAHWLRDC